MSTDTTATTYTKRWLETYLRDVVTAIRTMSWDIKAEIRPEIWCPEDGDEPFEPWLFFHVMHSEPNSNVRRFAWMPTEGWMYKIANRDDYLPLRNAVGGLLYTDEDPGLIGEAAAETITEHMRCLYPAPHIRKSINDSADNGTAATAVLYVLEAHKPRYSREYQSWVCSGCSDGSLPNYYPCSTIRTLATGFGANVL